MNFDIEKIKELTNKEIIKLTTPNSEDYRDTVHFINRAEVIIVNYEKYHQNLGESLPILLQYASHEKTLAPQSPILNGLVMYLATLTDIKSKDLWQVNRDLNTKAIVNNDKDKVYQSFIDICIYALGALYKISQTYGSRFHEYTLDKMRDLLYRIGIDKPLSQFIDRVFEWNEKNNLKIYNKEKELSFIFKKLYESCYINKNKNLSYQKIAKKLWDMKVKEAQTNHNFKQIDENALWVETQYFFQIFKQFLSAIVVYAKIWYGTNNFLEPLNNTMDENDKLKIKTK